MVRGDTIVTSKELLGRSINSKVLELLSLRHDPRRAKDLSLHNGMRKSDALRVVHETINRDGDVL